MIRCFRDSHGFLRAEVEDHPGVGSYLEGDVQSGPESCREILRVIEEVESGQSDAWEGTGNAFTVTIRPEGVTFENIWDESLDIETLSLVEFKAILNVWLKCITEIS